MKFLKILILFSIYMLNLHASNNEVEIEWISKRTAVKSSLVKAVLKIEKNKIYCQNRNDPLREIKIRALKNLKAPFVDAKNSINSCPDILKWGNSKTCLEKTNPRYGFMMKILRSCAY